jgi:hypothetical protein
MKRLGEILLEHGYTTVGELHTALEASHRHRTTLGTQLLRLGFVTETQLLEALAEQTKRPRVTREMLRTTPAELRRLLPVEVARRLRVAPFARNQGELHVAFSNPRDVAAVEEIQATTGLLVRPFVATEDALTEALAVLAGDAAPAEAAPLMVETALPMDLQWERQWAGRPPGPEDLLALGDVRPPAPDPGAMYATYPGLSPVMDPGSVAEVGFLDEAGFEHALLAAESRHAVGEALLGYAAQFLTRLCLFSVFKDSIQGWMVSGLGPVLEDVRAFSADLDNGGVLQQAARSGRPHQGPPPPGETNDAVAACLGDPPSLDMVVVPIHVKERPVGFLVGDIPGQSTIAVPVGDLAVAANVTGVALEAIILRRKISKALSR